MTGNEIAVKKYVVRLSAEERDQLNDMIRSAKRSAQLLTKGRLLLKADVSHAGEGWSDGRIVRALDTSIANIKRTRRQLVEEGFAAVLKRARRSPRSRDERRVTIANMNAMAWPRRRGQWYCIWGGCFDCIDDGIISKGRMVQTMFRILAGRKNPLRAALQMGASAILRSIDPKQKV